MTKSIKILLIVAVVAIGAASILYITRTPENSATYDENVSFVVGYDTTKKQEIFGNMSEDEISDTLIQKTLQLQEANKEGKCDSLIEDLRCQGFIITIEENDFSLIDIEKRKILFGDMTDEEIFDTIGDKLEEMTVHGVEPDLEDVLKALEAEANAITG